MKFEQGKSGNPAGRPKGVANKFTRSVKETVLEVFKTAQEDPDLCLMQFLRDNPRDFYNIAAKLIPLDVKSEITVPEGIKIIFQNDSESLPIGTNPEDHIGIQGE